MPCGWGAALEFEHSTTMPDSRQSFFSQTLEALLGAREFSGTEALSKFMDDPSITVLRAIKHDGKCTHTLTCGAVRTFVCAFAHVYCNLRLATGH